MIAVTLPTYNQLPERLNAAVESCLGAGADLVVIWDDGSTPPVLNRWDVSRVLVVGLGGNAGVPRAFNGALEVALSHEPTWIARFASDDVMVWGKLTEQVALMQEMGWQASFTDCLDGRTGTLYETGMPTQRDWPDVNRARWRKRLRAANRFAGTTSVIAADAMRRYRAEGGHPAWLPYCHDWYLNAWVEHEVSGGWHYIPSSTVVIGRHADGMEAQSQRDPLGDECRALCAEAIAHHWGQHV